MKEEGSQSDSGSCTTVGLGDLDLVEAHYLAIYVVGCPGC